MTCVALFMFKSGRNGYTGFRRMGQGLHDASINVKRV